MTKINPEHFFKEINHNLGILENTISKGGQPDRGFIDIFKNDIRLLSNYRFDAKKIKNLSDRISRNETRIASASRSVLQPMKDVVVPFIGNELSLKEKASAFNEGLVKKGYETLDSQYRMRPIKGDGHCLFRSIATGILVNIANSVSGHEQVMSRIGELINLYPHKPKFNQINRVLDDIKNKRSSIDKVLLNKNKSNLLVEFLRLIACRYIQENQNDQMREMAIEHSGSLDIYLDQMRRMIRPEFPIIGPEVGGQLEIIALADILGLRIHNLDVRAIGQGLDANANHSYYGDSKHPEISLLFRPGHYDLALKK